MTPSENNQQGLPQQGAAQRKAIGEARAQTFAAFFHLNGCSDDGGHVYLADNGIAWCIYCGRRAP